MLKSFIFDAVGESTTKLIVTEVPLPNLVHIEIWRDGNSTALTLTRDSALELQDIFSNFGDHITFVNPPEEPEEYRSDDYLPEVPPTVDAFGGGS